MNIEVIEKKNKNHQIEYGISFSGRPLRWDKYVKCHDKLEALRLKGLIEQFTLETVIVEVEKQMTKESFNEITRDKENIARTTADRVVKGVRR